MDGLKTTRLTVAKLCHEMSGCLSIMKFLEEDLEASQSTDDLKLLFSEIDIMSSVMDFFRAVYSCSYQKTKIYETVVFLYKVKKVSLQSLLVIQKIFDDFENGNEENILAGVLYVVLKSCRSSSAVFVENVNSVISITTENASLAYGTINALNNDDAEEDVFNVFAKYIRILANLEKYVIQASSLLNGGVNITICKL